MVSDLDLGLSIDSDSDDYCNHKYYFAAQSGKFNTSLLIQADQDIVVYALNKYKWSSESYLGIPVDGTGYDYYAATTTVRTSGEL